MAISYRSLAQRLNPLRSFSTKAGSTAPFIGPGDVRYDTFMGINQGAGRLANTPLGRIEIANSAIWVHSCIQARANSLRNVPLKLKRAVENGVDETVDDHPILELLATVNPYSDSESSLRVNIEQSLSIHGRYQILKVRNDAGIVRELYGLPTQFCIPMPDPVKFIRSFRYRVGGFQTEYSPKDIVYFRYPPYDGGIDGLGPLQVAVETTKADINIARAQNSISENGARPSMMVTLANQLDDEDYERLMDQLVRNYAGVANAGKIMLLDNASEAKATPYQLTPREMEWVREHSAHAKDICAAFQVPPVVAGDYAESSVLANAGAAHRFFWELWVLPELELWEDTLNWQLLWAEDWGHGVGWEAKQGLYLKHDVSNVAALREDENSRSTRATQLFTSGATINQTLEMRGLPPIKDQRGDVILVPQNLLPLDTVLATLPPGSQADTSPDVDVGDQTADTAAALSEEKNKQREWQNGNYVPKGPPSQSNAAHTPVMQQTPALNNGSVSGKTIDLSLGAKTDLRRWRAVAKKSLPRALKFESSEIPDWVQANLRAVLETKGEDEFRLSVNRLLQERQPTPVVEVKAVDDYILRQEGALAITLVALVRQYYQDRDSDKLYQNFKQALFLSFLAVALFEDGSLSNTEQAALDNALAAQYGYASGFVTSLRDGDVSATMAEARARLYARALEPFAYQMQLLADLDANYEWQMDADAEHCVDCIELHGEVRKGSEWLNYHIPRDGSTECNIGCKCKLKKVS